MHQVWVNGTSPEVWILPRSNHANQMEPRVHLKTRHRIRTSYELLYVTTVREGGTEPWLCRTSAFSLINRLGNWVVVPFFLFTDSLDELDRDARHVDVDVDVDVDATVTFRQPSSTWTGPGYWNGMYFFWF
jgi:hypothetical protein